MESLLTQRIACIVFFVAAASAALGVDTATKQGDENAVRRPQRRLELVDEVDNDVERGSGPGVRYLPPLRSAKLLAPDQVRAGWRPLVPVVSRTPSYAEPLLSPLAFRPPGHRVPSQLLLPPRGTYSQRAPFAEELDGYQGAGPSLTEPFWEEVDRRRQRLLLGFPDQHALRGQHAPGRAPGCGCGQFHPTRLTEPSGDFLGDGRRLGSYGPYGVGAYGLYGWSHPKHYHNSAPLGARINHDNPN